MVKKSLEVWILILFIYRNIIKKVSGPEVCVQVCLVPRDFEHGPNDSGRGWGGVWSFKPQWAQQQQFQRCENGRKEKPPQPGAKTSSIMTTYTLAYILLLLSTLQNSSNRKLFQIYKGWESSWKLAEKSLLQEPTPSVIKFVTTYLLKSHQLNLLLPPFQLARVFSIFRRNCPGIGDFGLPPGCLPWKHQLHRQWLPCHHTLLFRPCPPCRSLLALLHHSWAPTQTWTRTWNQ